MERVYLPSTLAGQRESEARVPVHRHPNADDAQSLGRHHLAAHHGHPAACMHMCVCVCHVCEFIVCVHMEREKGSRADVPKESCSWWRIQRSTTPNGRNGAILVTCLCFWCAATPSPHVAMSGELSVGVCVCVWFWFRCRKCVSVSVCVNVCMMKLN